MSVRLTALRARIGGDVSGNRGTFPGPGHSRKDRSLSLYDLGQRVIAYSFSGDDWSDVTQYLADNGIHIIARDTPLTAKEKREYAAMMKAARAEQEREDARKRAAALAIWAAGLPLRDCALGDTLVHIYLRSRGLRSPRNSDLRFAPACPLSPYKPSADTSPAMLALVTNTAGVAIGLHITYLTGDGAKRPGNKARLMLARQAGGMVRLSAPAETLAVAEGIETALAYTALHGVPCWAARSALGVTQFRPPPSVRNVIIAADADTAGQQAAEELQMMLRNYVPRVTIDTPPHGDWNDILLAGAHG